MLFKFTIQEAYRNRHNKNINPTIKLTHDQVNI